MADTEEKKTYITDLQHGDSDSDLDDDGDFSSDGADDAQGSE
jgi:hypothetical protein